MTSSYSNLAIWAKPLAAQRRTAEISVFKALIKGL